MATRFGDYSAAALAGGLGEKRIDWLKSLCLYHLAPPYLFVHAGIVPGRPLEAQEEKDLLWIRDRFLDSDVDHGFVVVHGHTPTTGPDVRHNRIGIDTGVIVHGVLTAAVLDNEREPQFLSVEGDPLF